MPSIRSIQPSTPPCLLLPSLPPPLNPAAPPALPPQLSQLTVTSTNGVTASGFTSTTSTASTGSTGLAASGGATSAVQPTVVDIDTRTLVVDIPTITGAPGVTTPAINLNYIVDTEPPVITLRGQPYVSVLQTASYTDAGATVYDNIDGNSIQPRKRLLVCRRPADVEKARADDSRPLTCNATLYAAVNTSTAPEGWVWVFTYSAKDTAGNSAVPLRRIVEVKPR